MTTSPSDAPPGPPGPPAAHFAAGVDGGGSGTRVRLQDLAGHTLGQGVAGPSALGQGIAQAWRHVRQALDAACAEAGLAPLPPAHIALGLGLAGAGVAAQRAAFLAADPGFATLELDNDGITQLLGAHGGAPGIVVAAGTGSVAAALLPDGRLRQAGGWGFPVGDEGSGAWLGLQAMRQAHAVLDGRAAPGAMTEAVCARAGGNASALLAWCAEAGAGAHAAAYASLAPLVFTAAEQGDAAAASLLQAAADELARLVHALQPAHSPPVPPLPLVASGSIGERLAPRWPAALRQRLVKPRGDSADGALHLLRRRLAA